MKFAIATLALAGAVAAQVDAIPACAKPCIDKAVTDNGCDVNDYACSCAKQQAITNSAAQCVLGACSADELTATLAAVQGICDNLPPPSTEPATSEPADMPTNGGYPVAQPTETEGAYPSETEGGYPSETEGAYPSETETEGSYPTGYTTSTVYSTTVYTVTSCAETVTNCPAHSTVVTTEVVPAYTTVCPIETPGYSAAPSPTEYPPVAQSSTYCPPTLTTSYAGTGTGGVYPTETTSQIQVTAGAAVVGSMGGVAALALAALAAF